VRKLDPVFRRLKPANANAAARNWRSTNFAALKLAQTRNVVTLGQIGRYRPSRFAQRRSRWDGWNRSGGQGGGKMHDRTTLGALVSIWCSLWTGVAFAECNSPGFNPTPNGFCNGCRYEGSMVVTRDQACERPYRPHPKGPATEIVGNRIVQRARHGIAGISTNTMAYKPNPGYVGRDEFVVEVAYRQANEPGKFYVHFAVTVQ
jgi:hypothetical protein